MYSFINKKIVLAVSLLTLSSISQASLITNGSFEETGLVTRGEVHNTLLNAYEDKSSTWDIFYDLPGWRTTYGNGIELQKNVVTSAQDGNHHVELDSHMSGSSNSVMTQSLNSLTVGADYLLEFYYKARTNNANDNGINVYWYDTSIDFNWDMQATYTADGKKRETQDWVLKSVSFTAESTSMDLSFASIGNQNTLGGLIDNVSLVQTTSVPEPAAFAMFLVAGFGMFFMQRRKQNK